MALGADVYDPILFTNLKVTTDAMNHAFLLATQNAVSNQHNVNTLAQTALTRAIDTLLTTDVPEGLGIAAAQRGDLAKQIADLGAAVMSAIGSIKGGGNVPPVTP